MYTYNEPEIKNQVECEICKTIIKGIDLNDLDWTQAKLHLNQPCIKCPICGNEIYNVLEEVD